MASAHLAKRNIIALSKLIPSQPAAKLTLATTLPDLYERRILPQNGPELNVRDAELVEKTEKALVSLLNNDAAKEYPMSKRLLQPKGDPKFFAEMERDWAAAHGLLPKKKSLFSRLFGSSKQPSQ